MSCPCYNEEKFCEDCAKTKISMSSKERDNILKKLEEAEEFLEELKGKGVPVDKIEEVKRKNEAFKNILKNAPYVNSTTIRIIRRIIHDALMFVGIVGVFYIATRDADKAIHYAKDFYCAYRIMMYLFYIA